MRIDKQSGYDVKTHIYVNSCVFTLTDVSADWIRTFHLKDLLDQDVPPEVFVV